MEPIIILVVWAAVIIWAAIRKPNVGVNETKFHK